MSERCKQTSEWTSEWPSTYVSIHSSSEPRWRRVSAGEGLAAAHEASLDQLELLRCRFDLGHNVFFNPVPGEANKSFARF